MMKWMIVVIIELILLLIWYFIHWIYKDEDHLVWSNDYDMIESLQGDMRNQFLIESKHLDYRLIKGLMIISLLILLPISTNWLAILIFTMTVGFCIHAIYQAFSLRKKYKVYIAS